MQAMGESIAEIIRVLQLTSQEEVMLALATETGSAQGTMAGGLLLGSLAAKVHTAKELITQTGTLGACVAHTGLCQTKPGLC